MRKYLQWVISIAVSAIAFWLAFRGVQVAEVADTLRTANYFYVLPALACIVVGLMARALSWQTILGRKVPFWRAFTALNEGYLLSNVLPFRLGELGRAYLVSRPLKAAGFDNRGLSTSQAFSSVIVERMIDLCMIVVLFATVLPLVAGLAWAREAAVLAVVISVAGMGGLFALTLNRALVLRLARWVMGHVRLPWFNAARWETRVVAFLDGLAALRDWRRFALAALASATAWVSASLCAWILMFAFLPAPTLPMGFFVLAFTFALIFHALNFGMTTVLGAAALSREGETLSHLAQAARGLMSGAEREAALVGAPRPNESGDPSSRSAPE
ncbi:MAG: hypothetical protein HW378_4789 [Anaerolineales bacterium]|nr:hypothetical protein [Anaerolineales bacterium]